jgi:hypothetical protein
MSPKNFKPQPTRLARFGLLSPLSRHRLSFRVSLKRKNPTHFTFTYEDILKAMAKPDSNQNIPHWTSFPNPPIKILNRMELGLMIYGKRPLHRCITTWSIRNNRCF